MDAQNLFDFLRATRFAVQASLSCDAPQAAGVGFAISNELEIVFDTLQTTRKATNIRNNPHVAFVIGGLLPGEERTIQYEGIADEPSGADLDRLKDIYYAIFPDAGAEHTGQSLFLYESGKVDPIQRLPSESSRDRGIPRG